MFCKLNKADLSDLMSPCTSDVQRRKFNEEENQITASLGLCNSVQESGENLTNYKVSLNSKKMS